MSRLTQTITTGRWRRVGPRLFRGNRRRCPERSRRKLPRLGRHRARPRTRSRDLSPATTKHPRMVRSLFSPHPGSLGRYLALLGSEAFICLEAGRQSRVRCVSQYAAHTAQPHPYRHYCFTSARHFPFGHSLLTQLYL